VIVEANKKLAAFTLALGGRGIAESVEQHNRIQNLSELFPGHISDTFPAPHVERIKPEWK
jgi:hypothetical protein